MDKEDKLDMHIQVEKENLGHNLQLQKCQSCQYSTKRKDILTQHYNAVHLKIKTLSCNFCPYYSSQKGTLNRHIRLRHGTPKLNISLAAFGYLHCNLVYIGNLPKLSYVSRLGNFRDINTFVEGYASYILYDWA